MTTEQSNLVDSHQIEPNQPTLRLGKINERLAPVSISGDGLASLGFFPAATDKRALLYHEADFPAICRAIAVRVSSIADLVPADSELDNLRREARACNATMDNLTRRNAELVTLVHEVMTSPEDDNNRILIANTWHERAKAAFTANPRPI
jgi:hypothetical protein